MKANEIMDLYSAFSKLTNYDMDLDTASKILDNVDSLSNPYKIIEKKRMEIIKKHAEKNDDGEVITFEKGTIHIMEDHIIDCNNELYELLNEETEVEIKPISKSSLTNIKISPNDLSVLRKYFVG